MQHSILSKLSRSQLDELAPGSRARTLEAIRKWKEADAELKRICKELGIDVPEMEC
jgi:hypothetical protein